jgi:outer membrane biosynthesis protein TonB
MSNAELVYEGDDDNFFSLHLKKLMIAGILLLGLAVYFMPKPGPSGPVRKAEKIVSVQLPPPPPPKLPPPPPKLPPPPEKIEKPVAVEEKQKAAPKKADNPPSTALATGIKGDGPGMGLASSGNGLGGGGGIGGNGGGGGGGKWDGYAGQVQSRISEALRLHPKTKSASISRLEVRIWPDPTGHITRAELAGSTGNAEIDQAIQKVLSDLRLEAPPAGMKSIALRLSARRP